MSWFAVLTAAFVEVNHSDTNNSNTTSRALAAFRSLCNKRRGTNSSRHILCCVMDQNNAYHQRDYGSLDIAWAWLGIALVPIIVDQAIAFSSRVALEATASFQSFPRLSFGEAFGPGSHEPYPFPFFGVTHLGRSPILCNERLHALHAMCLFTFQYISIHINTFQYISYIHSLPFSFQSISYLHYMPLHYIAVHAAHYIAYITQHYSTWH